MPAKKRTYDKIRQLYFDIFYLEMPVGEAGKLNGLSHSVTTYALKDCVYYKLITPKQYEEFQAKSKVRGYNGLLKKFTSEQMKEKFSDMGIKSAVSNGIDSLVEKAIKGGNATQKKHWKRVKKNLKKAKHYGATGCKHGDIWFDSQGERMTGLLLKSYGLLDDIVMGENFQKEFGRCTADFYLKDKDMIIEYHPIPRQTFNKTPYEVDVDSSIESYAQKRKEQLKYHFQGKIVAIPAPSGRWSAKEFYTKMPEIGIAEDWHTFLQRCKTMRKDIAEFEKQYQLELNGIALKEDDVPF